NAGPRVGLAYKIGRHMVLRSAYGLFYSAEAIPATSLGANNPPFIGSLTFTNGQNDFAGARRVSQGFTTLPSVVFSPIGASLFSVATNFRTPCAQQWNFGLQNELPGQVLLSVSYVGTAGKKLVLNPDINQPAPGPGAVGPRRPYPQFAGISYLESS